MTREVKDAKLGLASSLGKLREITHGSLSPYLSKVSDDLVCAQQKTRDSVLAFAGVDEFILGYKDRSAVLSEERANTIVPGSNGMFLSTIVADGRVLGTWRRQAKSNTVQLEAVPFNKPSRKERSAFERSIREWGRFNGVEVQIQAI
jgi:hypothetical protein